eukprot:12421223-Prorocentrum_lima.AAC.1
MCIRDRPYPVSPQPTGGIVELRVGHCRGVEEMRWGWISCAIRFDSLWSDPNNPNRHEYGPVKYQVTSVKPDCL